MDQEEFLRFRDSLVNMLESNWPEIEPTCVPTVKAAPLRLELKRIVTSSSGQDQLCAEHLVKHSLALFRFLATDRFRGDPRQIANAMAGVPMLSIWRSLKLAQAFPSEIGIGQRAIKAYLRRKHPTCYRKLQERVDVVHFAITWSRYHTKDKLISALPSRAIHWEWMNT